jgi:hypothetical protein
MMKNETYKLPARLADFSLIFSCNAENIGDILADMEMGVFLGFWPCDMGDFFFFFFFFEKFFNQTF